MLARDSKRARHPWDASDRKPCPRFVRKFGDDISGIRRVTRAAPLFSGVVPWDAAQLRHRRGNIVVSSLSASLAKVRRCEIAGTDETLLVFSTVWCFLFFF